MNLRVHFYLGILISKYGKVVRTCCIPTRKSRHKYVHYCKYWWKNLRFVEALRYFYDRLPPFNFLKSNLSSSMKTHNYSDILIVLCHLFGVQSYAVDIHDSNMKKKKNEGGHEKHGELYIFTIDRGHQLLRVRKRSLVSNFSKTS